MALPSTTRKFTKKPGERYPQLIRYANRLPPGTALDSVTVTAVDANENDISEDIIDGVEILADTQKVQFYVFGGVDGLRATITITATLDDHDDPELASTLIDHVIMLVRP